MFRRISLSTITGMGIVAMATLASADSALALSATTTFSDLDDIPTVDEAVFNWSTYLTSGTVTASDLTDWTIILKSGGSAIYTDNVIIGGSVQPIGGVARSIGDLTFNYDFGTGLFTTWDNDLNVVQSGAATGVTYNIFEGFPSGNFNIALYNDGTFQSNFADSSFSQNTVPVPFEVNPGLGLFLVGGIWGINKLRRKKANLS